MDREKAIKEMREKLPWLTEDTKRLVEALIPELRESEDERIRKAIIEHFKQSETEFPGLTFGGYYYADVLAYLEKQKEQKPTDDVLHRTYQEGFNDGLNYRLEGTGVKYVKDNPKQEWSEEDERTIDRVCVALRAYANGELPDILPSEILEYADKLQSLRPQPHWKPTKNQLDALNLVIMDYTEDGCIATANYLQEISAEIKKL